MGGGVLSGGSRESVGTLGRGASGGEAGSSGEAASFEGE